MRSLQSSTNIYPLNHQVNPQSSYLPDYADHEVKIAKLASDSFSAAKHSAKKRYCIRKDKELTSSKVNVVDILFPYFKTLIPSISYFDDKAKVYYSFAGVDVIIDLFYDHKTVFIGLYNNEESRIIESSYRKIASDLKKLPFAGN